MQTVRRLPHALQAAFLAVAAAALVCAAPARATVSTIFSCPEGTNEDNVSNGFLLSGLGTNNLNTVTLYYTTSATGEYTISLTAQTGSFSGPLVGNTLTQVVNLTNGSYTQVTWNFAGASFTEGATLAFSHQVTGGPGEVSFNMQDTICNGDEETVGLSSIDNGFSVATVVTTIISSGNTGSCVATGTTLCIDDVPGDHRFQLTSTYATSEGGGESGTGHAIALSSLGVTEGGLFWFFAATNPEMLIKVIDGCTLGGHFWVFYAATTNVGFDVTVTDTETGHTAKYSNKDLTAAPPVQDTSALACP